MHNYLLCPNQAASQAQVSSAILIVANDTLRAVIIYSVDSGCETQAEQPLRIKSSIHGDAAGLGRSLVVFSASRFENDAPRSTARPDCPQRRPTKAVGRRGPALMNGESASRCTRDCGSRRSMRKASSARNACWLRLLARQPKAA